MAIESHEFKSSKKVSFPPGKRHLMVLTGQAVATAARAWGNQGLLLVQSKFGTALSRSFFQASTPGSAVYGFPRGVSGVASVDFSTGRLGAGADLRPYRTVAPAVERIVVIGDVHGDIGDDP